MGALERFCLAAVLTCIWGFSYAQCTTNPSNQSIDSLPSNIAGRVAFQTYSPSYDLDNNSCDAGNQGPGAPGIWVHDFYSKTTTEISAQWCDYGIANPLNAVWSPDGKWLIFDAVSNDAHNLFVVPANNLSQQPINLTNSVGDQADTTRNEDPKFSSDSKNVVFKYLTNTSNPNIAVRAFNVSNGVPSLGSTTTTLTNNTSGSVQYSAPYLTPGNSGLYYYQGGGKDASGNPIPYQLYYEPLPNGLNGVGGTPVPVGQHGYYPIVRLDGVTFYADNTSGHDQMTYVDSSTGTPMQANVNDCNNDNSDSWPINGSSYVMYGVDVASTSPVIYQLYLGDVSSGNASSGSRWNLSSLLGSSFNSSLTYLGPSYYPLEQPPLKPDTV